MHVRTQVAKHGVHKEVYAVSGKTLLTRGENGQGSLLAVDAKQTLRFEVPKNQLAAVLKRNSIQHPYLQELFEWASSVKAYRFGSEMGARELVIDASALRSETPPTEAQRSSTAGALDYNKLFLVYKQGISQFGKQFDKDVIKTLRQLDYRAEKIGFGHLERNEFAGAPIPPSFLYVKERDLRCNTRQLEMSAGMFRAFNLAVQLNY